MRILIFVTHLIVGLTLVAYGLVSSMKPIAVWSDLKAYSAKVASDEQAKHALQYGGEKEGTDFEYILDRMWDLNNRGARVVQIGIVVFLLATIGIILELVNRKRQKVIEPVAEGDG